MARSEGRSEEASESRDETFVGRTIGKYTLARVIGRGGMGVVYEALNTTIGKRVAMKLVSSELCKNKDAVRRFQREAQAASAVESAHIVDIFDAGVSDDGVPYIVMELLRGEDLGHRIKRLGRLELEDAIHITIQILRGLARAHTAGIVHRDLKPDNVFLVDRDDDATFVKVLDFGISKVARSGQTPVQTLTKQGTVLGTPFYMSPEQAQGLPDTDGRADLWSVGAILYECLTGRAPHTGASYEQVIVHICTKDADDVRLHNPGVPEAVAQVIAQALEREREDRFECARDFLEALSGAAHGTMTLSPRSSDEPSGPGGSRRSSGATPLPAGSRSGGRSNGGLRSSRGGAGGAAKSGAKSGAAAFDETLEVLKGGGPSRVGWATNGGTAVGRDRKRLVVVALGALALGVVATVAVAMRKPGDVALRPGEADSALAAGGRPEVTVRLRANVHGARFMVDGQPVAGGLLRGAQGERKKVMVEADGYAPVEAVIALEPDREPPELLLSTHEVGAPPASASAAASVAASTTASTEVAAAPTSTAVKPGAARVVKGPGFKPGPLATGKPAASATTLAVVSVAPTATAAPMATPTLKIKRD